MLPIDIALLVAVGALVVGVTGWLGLRLDRRRRDDDAERLGRANAERLKREQERRCVHCDGAVDPAVDVFDRDAWWCRECWLKVTR